MQKGHPKRKKKEFIVTISIQNTVIEYIQDIQDVGTCFKTELLVYRHWTGKRHYGETNNHIYNNLKRKLDNTTWDTHLYSYLSRHQRQILSFGIQKCGISCLQIQMSIMVLRTTVYRMEVLPTVSKCVAIRGRY